MQTSAAAAVAAMRPFEVRPKDILTHCNSISGHNTSERCCGLNTDRGDAKTTALQQRVLTRHTSKCGTGAKRLQRFRSKQSDTRVTHGSSKFVKFAAPATRQTAMDPKMQGPPPAERYKEYS